MQYKYGMLQKETLYYLRFKCAAKILCYMGFAITTATTLLTYMYLAKLHNDKKYLIT